jgi:glycosyltransferase involved in cell wall biosynthesis
VNTPQRIMQVVYSFAIGGSEMVARDIAIGLAKAGWASGVCALEYDGPLRAELEEQGVSTAVIAKQGRGMFGPMYRLWQAFRAFRPDVVHTHHVYELVYSWPGALLCGARLIHTEHEFHSLAGDRRRFILRVLSNLCRKVTAVNEETAAYLRDVVKIPSRKVVTVVNGIDLERFSVESTLREELQVTDATPLIGIVARLEPPKNHVLLFRAFRQVVEHIPETRLVVVGDGSLRQSLEELSVELDLTDRIIFLGERRDIPNLLAAMNLFVLSSDREGLPVALLEAMAAGLPIVSTSAGGIPSVIEDGVTGLLVGVGNEEGLGLGIERVLKDDELKLWLGKNGKEYVLKHYDLEQVITRYMSLYVE